MGMCPYCAQTRTKKDGYGYCKIYDCFGISGKKNKLNQFIKRASDLYDISEQSKPLSIRSYVSNYYNPRTRAANDLIYDVQKEFGFVPFELYDKIPMKNREKWDKNIRW